MQTADGHYIHPGLEVWWPGGGHDPRHGQRVLHGSVIGTGRKWVKIARAKSKDREKWNRPHAITKQAPDSLYTTREGAKNARIEEQ